MNLVISFSGRKNGNCDSIANFIKTDTDQLLFLRDLDIHSCANCNYECFTGECRFRTDDVYGIYESMLKYEKVFLIVPMYCGNPCSLYFAFHKRSQDYFMHNETYDKILPRLYIIGIYGSAEETPEFVPSLEKWFQNTAYRNHVLGIQRHLLGHQLNQCVLDDPEIRTQLMNFLHS